jgi:CheY-like chemotaxis protein
LKGDRLKAKHPKRILIAVTPSSTPLLSQILGSTFELIFSTSLHHAQAQLNEGVDLVACDIHFDDCRMFDLLRLSKANPATRQIPFLCLKVVEGVLDQALYQSVDIASSALGAAGFVDLFQLKQDGGDEQAHKNLIRIIRQLATHGIKL